MIKKLFLHYFLASSLFVTAQQSYYDDVDLTKTGLELRDELATKVINTHTNFLSYTPGVWEASKVTDVNPDNPDEVILIYGYTDDGDTAKTLGIDDQNSGDANGWNREHVYAKSLGTPSFSNSSNPGSDAHHLRPSDVQQNSARGNQKFAAGSGEASGDVTGGWYPGDEWKGDVARMMFYMYLRYGNQCLPSNVAEGTTNAVDPNMIDLLLEWNAQDPVSIIEETRNEFHENTSNTYAQGNRNPFIDNPYLATVIWGGPEAEKIWDLPTASTNDNLNLKQGINVYPNPSITGTIHISINSDIDVNAITIFSVLGKKVYHNANVINHTLNIDLSTGIYLLKVSTNTSSTTKKLVVQ